MTERAKGLRVVSDPTWDGLCARVADTLRVPLDDPFDPDVLVVPSRGHQRFLSQSLAGSFGPDRNVCAGVDFPSMGALRRRIERGVLGIDPHRDPWRGPGLSVAVLNALTQIKDEPWGQLLRNHLGQAHPGEADPRPGRRAADAAWIARLFRRYLTRCPQLLLMWDEGADTRLDGGPLDEADAWQPPLWRMLTTLVHQVPHPGVRHRLLLAGLQEIAVATDGPGAGRAEWLPARLGVVVLAPLRPDDRELVEALARLTPTTLYAWQPLFPATAPTGFAARYSSLLRAESSTIPLAEVATDQASTLLRRIQDDIRHQRTPLLTPQRHADGSVQIHASHGPDRQVEVLREILCGLLDDDPTLEPRDILVVCTDLDRYAPLIQADFCLADAAPGRSHPGQGLRAQVDTSALRRPNAVLASLREVLSLGRGRATARNLLDLCEQPFVAARFGFDADDLARLPDLLAASGVIWGIDQAHREAFGLGHIRQGTWFQGTQHLDLAVALAESPTAAFGQIAPAAGVDGTDAELIGKLDELIRRVRLCRLRCHEPATLSLWLDRLRAVIELLFAPSGDDRWLFDEANQALSRLEPATDTDTLLACDDVLGLVGAISSVPRGRAIFGNGSMLFTQLGVLDAVPHRIVCVLGLDDQHFPPRLHALGGDLTDTPDGPGAWDDPRSRARQALCDAILSAKDRLIVVTQGANPRTNTELPPSVAILDLLEACAVEGPAGTWRPDASQASDHLVRHHPLQPYAWGDFVSEGGAWPFSFDEDARRGATRLLSPPASPPAPLWQIDFGASTETVDTLDLDLLIRFFRNPAAELLRLRTGLRTTDWGTQLPEALIGPSDPLLTWRLGDLILHDLLSGTTADQARANALHLPQLPPGRFGATLVDKAGQDASAIAQTWTSLGRTPTPRQIEVPLSGRSLVGQVDADGAVVATSRFGWIKAPHLVDAWIRLLALSAAAGASPAPPIAALVGKGPLTGLVAPPPHACATLLAQMVALREAGLRRLVPLPPQTGHDLARAKSSPSSGSRGANSPQDAARAAWQGRWGAASGEAADPAWSRFFPGGDLDELLEPQVLPGDPGTGTASRFERLATWFWQPVLAATMNPAALRAAMGGARS